MSKCDTVGLMPVPLTQFSEDQAEAFDRIAELLQSAGIDIEECQTTPRTGGGTNTLAVIGKAGSGKTMLLARLAEALTDAGVDTVSGDYEGRRRKARRTLAILPPTNKAGSVLRTQGVAGTTIHRILYTRRFTTRSMRRSRSGLLAMVKGPRLQA